MIPRFYILLAGVLISISVQAFAPINISRPWDRPLIPEDVPGTLFQITPAYEGAFHLRGVQADEDDHRSFEERKTNVLRLWQDEQDALAALKGLEPHNSDGQLAQLCNINDDNLTHGLFRPHGCLEIPVNLMLSARYYFPHGFSAAAFIAYYYMRLRNVVFEPTENSTFFESRLQDATKLLDRAASQGGIRLGGWTRHGFGDLLLQGRWMRNFPQYRPLLLNVRPQVRFGVFAPTGKKQNEDELIAFGFGNDGSWALDIAGGLDLTFTPLVRGGVDAEFIYQFGNTRDRRLQSDLAQTDLLFVTKACSFKEYGLFQQYNIYVETLVPYIPGLSFKLNYQHLKNNENKLYAGRCGGVNCGDRLDTQIVNDANSLQEWSINSLLFGVQYAPVCSSRWYKPFVSAWYKWGFIGKRALLADTVGISVSLNF